MVGKIKINLMACTILILAQKINAFLAEGKNKYLWSSLMVGNVGYAPTTSAMSMQRSTIELIPQS